MKSLKLFELTAVCSGFSLYMVHSQMSKLQEGQFVIAIVVSLLIESKFKKIDQSIFRTDDAGLWACLLVPAVLQITDPDRFGLISLLPLLSLLVYVQHTYQLVPSLFVTAGLLVYLITLCLLQKITFSVSICGVGILYCYLLWYLPRWFPRSFTFGEVSMVTQLFTYFLYQCLSWHFENKIDDLDEVMDLLIGTIFIGVLAVVLIIAQYRRLGSAGVIILVAMAAFICISVIFYLIGLKALYFNLRTLLWTHTSLLLLTWWLLCTLHVGSLVLVMQYGATPSREQPSTDQADMLYSQNKKTVGFTTMKNISRNSPKSKDKSRTSKQSLKGNSGNQSIMDKSENIKPNLQKIIYQEKEEVNNEFIDKRKYEMKTEVQEGVCNRIGQHTEGEINMYSKKGSQKSESNGNQLKSDSLAGNQIGDTSLAGIQSEISRVPVYVRKYFHGAVLCVYIPGLLYNPQLLYLATVVAAGVMVVIEVVRVADVDPISPVLNQYLKVFLDQQDQGDLILTPIYLLLGCSLPLWLSHKDQGCISVYAGLIAVGVGDSMASIVGRAYGHHKWPESKKSYEGSLSAFVGQILAIVILGKLGVSGSSLNLPIVVSMLLSVCLEACSTQIDNLVVPIFTFMLLTAIETQHSLPAS